MQVKNGRGGARLSLEAELDGEGYYTAPDVRMNPPDAPAARDELLVRSHSVSKPQIGEATTRQRNEFGRANPLDSDDAELERLSQK